MNESDLSHRLVAILAADAVGYSRLMASDEQATVIALQAARDVFRAQTLTHRGRVVDTAGDSVLAVFETATGAVAAALAVQAALALQSAAAPHGQQMRFRIGVHLGDVIEQADGTVYGDGVNIAARIQNLAEPGGLAISDAVFGAVRGKVQAEFAARGAQTVKNIPYPVNVYSASVTTQAVSPSPARDPPLPSDFHDPAVPNAPSIAVLPFDNLSRDIEQNYFADGIVDDIVNGLARIKWLFVIGRNSSAVYKGKADVKQIGRDLGVRYLLEGSIRKSGNRVRVTSQLIEAQTGAHLWAERYDRSLSDIFEVQDDIAMSVVGAIEPNLRTAEIERVKRTRPNSLDAYDLLMRALPFAYTAMPEDSTKAIPMLEKALAIDPDYAAAHAALAWCAHQRFSRGGLSEEDRSGAVQHAAAAITHGGDDATALAIAGFVIALDAHDSDTALSVFDRALALSSSNVFALRCSAITLAWMGKSELAIERAQLALRLSPYDALSFLAYIPLSVSYFSLKQFEMAASAARHAASSNPRFSVPLALLAAALVRLGRNVEARAVGMQVLALDRAFSIGRFAVTVGLSSRVFDAFANAWREAGLPD
jgi:TolB-like protein/class 3 adenylate cyclase